MKFLRYLLAVIVALGTVILVVSIMADSRDVLAATFAQMSAPTACTYAHPWPASWHHAQTYTDTGSTFDRGRGAQKSLGN